MNAQRPFICLLLTLNFILGTLLLTPFAECTGVRCFAQGSSGCNESTPATVQNNPATVQNNPATVQNNPATVQNNPATVQNNPASTRTELCFEALPIELLFFSGYNKGNSNIIEWTTVSEVNNDYFTLERSINYANAFEIVGIVDGAGNSSQPLNYQYSDALNSNESPLPATIYYYRLRQTDFDGTYTYSNIIAIGIDGVELIKVFPNPSVDEINYMVASGDTTEATIELIEMLGRETLYKKAKLITGLNILKTDVSSLANGQYYLRISAGKGLSWSGKQFVINKNNHE